MRSPVVVTGAAGNLGSRLVPWLEASGRVVVPVDVRPFDHPRAVVDDLTVPGDRDWMAGAQAVVHLAGQPDPTAPWERVEQPNVTSTRFVLEAVRRHGVERLVLASSVWAMRGAWEAGGVAGGGPAEPGHTAYARSKATAEQVVADGAGDGRSIVVLRIGGRVPGDAAAMRLDAWEDSCWLGWQDFLVGTTCAVDVAVDRCVTATLVSDNPAGRWSLDPARDLLGFVPQQRFRPVTPPGRVRSTVRRVARRLRLS